MGGFTFSGKGMGSIACFFSGSSESSSCLVRFAAVGDEGSPLALRFPSTRGDRLVRGDRDGLPELVLTFNKNHHAEYLKEGVASKTK